MARRKKKKIVKVTAPVSTKPTETQYYWCVNCGHHGNYGSVRKRGLSCEMCSYDEITPYTEEEINSDDCHRDLKDFKTKKQAMLSQELPADHKEMKKVVKSSKELLKNLDDKYNKQSISEKIAEIRGIK